MSLEIEVAVLRRCEEIYGLPSQRIISRLREEATRPLPDLFPNRPQWKAFDWPASGNVNLQDYWREHDRREQLYSAK